MKYFLGVDVETTGQFLTTNAMIAFGCSVIGEDMKEVDTFVGYLKIPDGRTFETRCMTEFWKDNFVILVDILNKAQDPSVVMKDFVSWLDGVELKYPDLVVLSDNPGFDYAWIDVYLSMYTDRWSIYYQLKSIEIGKKNYSWRRIWDTDSAYHGVILERDKKFVEFGLEKQVGCQNDKWTNDHNPLTDARNIVSNYILYYKSRTSK